MVLLSILIKSITLVAILSVSGGIGYYYLTQPTTHMEKDSNTIERLHSSGTNQKGQQHVRNHKFQRTTNEFQHFCDHGNYIKDLELIVAEVQEESPIEATLDHELKLLSEHKQGNWQNLRIYADYSNLNVNSQQLSFIQNTLVKASIGFLEQSYKVYPASSIKLASTCGKLPVPSNLQNGLQGYDVAFLITANSYSENFLARAGPCILDPKTFRPVGGTVELNLSYLNKLDLNNFSTQDKSWYSWVQTTIHEMTHILGFSSVLYPYYINSSTNVKLGKSNVISTQAGRDWMITQKVKDRMQHHFACDNVIGGPMENDGGSGTAGSHWERTTFGNEAMTGSSFPDSVFTGFTFALMESTGWYLPDYSLSEPFNWGEKEGCDIANALCQNGKNEFCTGSEDGCSSDSMGIARCSTTDILAPGCGYWKAYGNADCRTNSDFVDMLAHYTGGMIGSGSRCFISNLALNIGFDDMNSLCYKASCDFGQIQFQIGTNWYSCTESGQQINIEFDGTSGQLTCPDIQRFCATTRNCPQDCSGVGTCRQTTCYCWKGYYGDDCSMSY